MSTYIFLIKSIEIKTTREATQVDLKSKIELLLSDILSQKHEAKVTLRFEKKKPDKPRKEAFQ